jgi:hypothetical protein
MRKKGSQAVSAWNLAAARLQAETAWLPSLRLCASALKSLLLLTSCTLSAAIEYSPWPAQMLEFELKPEFIITTAKNDHKEDLDFNLSVMPSQRWQTQVECGFFSSPERSPTYSHSSATARYVWLDDVIGDPFSLVTGCTVRSVSNAALHNPLTFYHSEVEFEGHVAIGTETAPCDTWSSRRWCALLLGVPTEGRLWGSLIAKNEWNFWNGHILACSLQAEANFGGKSLNSSLPFQGYKDIAYQFLDFGVEYRYTLSYSGELGFEYFYRVYAKNSPQNIQQFIFFIRYPFSL